MQFLAPKVKEMENLYLMPKRRWRHHMPSFPTRKRNHVIN